MFKSIFSRGKRGGSDDSAVDVTKVAGAPSLFKIAPEVETGMLVTPIYFPTREQDSDT
jgi:hypothetical protein